MDDQRNSTGQRERHVLKSPAKAACPGSSEAVGRRGSQALSVGLGLYYEAEEAYRLRGR